MLEVKTGVIAPLSVTNDQLPPPMVRARNILGVQVSTYSKTEALCLIERAINAKNHTKIAFLNAHGANVAWNDDAYVAVLKDFEVLADGIGVDVGSLINFGCKFPDNLNGTDFIPALFAFLKPGIKVALLGAAAGVGELAVKKMQADFPQHSFEVISDGYFSKAGEVELLAKLEKSKPDILLVALGNPAQEKWIAKNCSSAICTIAIGVGAYLDFAAGRVPRAPGILRKLRIEWAYRLWLEPGRMWKRYMIGNPLFVLRSFLQKFGWRDQK